MTRNAQFPFYEVKRVFLASPGDLVSERSRFPRLLETVNNLRAHSIGFHLETATGLTAPGPQMTFTILLEARANGGSQ